jgi:hypothetical protein
MVRIRGHHILCIKGFHGLGYAKPFIKKMYEMQDMFANLPDTEIELVSECDDICSCCPHSIDSVCQKGELSEERTREQDLNVFKTLGINECRVSTVKELNGIFQNKMNTFPQLVKICGICGWREICTLYVKLRSEWKTRSTE